MGRRGIQSDLETAARLLSGGRANAATIPWEQMRYQHVAAIRQALEAEGKALATVARMLAALRGVATAAWRLGYLDADQLARIKDVKAPKARRLPRGRHVDVGEISALFGACKPGPAGIRDAALLSLLYGGGLRRAEVVALQLEDYDQETGTVKVLAGKGGHQRTIHATNGAKDALDDWLQCRGLEAGPLLNPVNKSGQIRTDKRMSGTAVAQRLARLAGQAGVKALSPHDLRRSFVGALLDAGADIGAVQGLAGHASVNTTLRYDRRPDSARRRAAGLLHVPYKRPE